MHDALSASWKTGKGAGGHARAVLHCRALASSGFSQLAVHMSGLVAQPFVHSVVAGIAIY